MGQKQSKKKNAPRGSGKLEKVALFPPPPGGRAKAIEKGLKYRFLLARITGRLVSACTRNRAPLQFPNDPPQTPFTWPSSSSSSLPSTLPLGRPQPAFVAIRDAKRHNPKFPCCCLSSGAFRCHRGLCFSHKHNSRSGESHRGDDRSKFKACFRKSIPAQNWTAVRWEAGSGPRKPKNLDGVEHPPGASIGLHNLFLLLLAGCPSPIRFCTPRKNKGPIL